METSHQAILDLVAQRGLISPRDLNALGLPSVALTRLVRQGLLTRVGRGLYARPGYGSPFPTRLVRPQVWS